MTKEEINQRLNNALLKNKLINEKLELVCNITGKRRPTSRDYLRSKEEKGIDIVEFQKYYVCRQALQHLKQTNSVTLTAEYFNALENNKLNNNDLQKILEFNS